MLHGIIGNKTLGCSMYSAVYKTTNISNILFHLETRTHETFEEFLAEWKLNLPGKNCIPQ